MKTSRRLLSIAALSCALTSHHIGAATPDTSDPCAGNNVVTTCSEAALRAAVLQGGQVGLCCNGTITLSSTIEITRDVVLDATGHSVVISGNQAVRLFNVAPGISFTAVNLTLADGWHQGTDADEVNPGGKGRGGAIYSSGGIVQLSSCVVSNNQVRGGNGFMTMNWQFISAGDGEGGAIFSTNNGILSLEDSQFANNVAHGGEGAPVPTEAQARCGGSAFGGAVFCAGGSVQIQNSLFTNNACITPEGYRNQRAQGGAGYLQDATCVVQNTTFNGNKTQGTDSSIIGAAGVASAGGGIYATGGSVMLSRVKMAGNQALGGRGMRHASGGQSEGGGIFSTGELVVRESQFSANQTVAGGSGSQPRDGMGGGLCNLGSAALTGCTFEANLARGGNAGNVSGSGYPSRHGFGGGIFNRGSLLLTNCTISLNVAQGGDGFTSYHIEPGYSVGGGLFNTNGTVTLQNVTLASNSVAATGGLAAGGNVANTNGTITPRGSILAYGGSGGNAYGPLTDGGFNISSDASCGFGSSSLNATDPLLGPLADNGGPTWTMALAEDSPAIDFSSDPGAPATDQRGVARPGGLRADAGAFEFTTQGPLLMISVTGTGVQVSFTAQAETRYQLQSSTDLEQWTTEETLGQYSTTTPCVRQFSLGAGQVRFFRLRIE